MNTNPTRTGLGKPAGTCLLTRFHHCPAHFAFFRGQMHETPTNYASEPGYKRHRFSALHLQDLKGRNSCSRGASPHQFCNREKLLKCPIFHSHRCVLVKAQPPSCNPAQEIDIIPVTLKFLSTLLKPSRGWLWF